MSCHPSASSLTRDLRSALEERCELVSGAEVPVARLALVDRAVGDVVGVLDQAQVAGPAVLWRGGSKSILFVFPWASRSFFNCGTA